MKLLLDENLSHRVVSKIIDLYPGSSHVKDNNLIQADDEAVWNFAKQNNFIIVSKDSDFHQRSLVRGHPPKCIYLRVGNCSTERIIEVLRKEPDVIRNFANRAQESVLILM